jgi:hypothetical protein
VKTDSSFPAEKEKTDELRTAFPMLFENLNFRSFPEICVIREIRG